MENNDVVEVEAIDNEIIELPPMDDLPYEGNGVEVVQTDEEREEVVPAVGWKEIKALKRARYGEIAEKFNKAFVIKKKKTGQIVAIRAASAVHACRIIGWKPNHVVLIAVEEVEPVEEPIDA